MLNWLRPFSTFCFLDSHAYPAGPGGYTFLAAAGVRSAITASPGASLAALQQQAGSPDGRWWFGHLSYELKNEIENLHSAHPDSVGFPDLFFFEPEVMISLRGDRLEIRAADPEGVFQSLQEARPENTAAHAVPAVRQRISREEYLEIIRRLRAHIARGDCYEINFCQEFFAENARIDPFSVYRSLSLVSPNPFSALYRTGSRWLMAASPERFLHREGNRLISQPIKGTSPRYPEDPQMDAASRKTLAESAKDRSENVMVVDLVRNDLSRVCREGSVQVGELFGVYAFPQVYQMISTITGELKEDAGLADILRATFPMGSMTGAPKKRVMELIEQYEKTRRGLFSGALGYIFTGGREKDDPPVFDFSVIIRSLLYNQDNHYLSFQTGSGITWYSDPEKEWEECLLKAAALRKVLA